MRPLIFILIGADREIIDGDVFGDIVLVGRPEDLACELFFESALSAFGFEFLGAAACGFRIGAKIFPAGAVAPRAIEGVRISEIRARNTCGRTGRSWPGGRAESTATGSRAGVSGSGFVHSERPAFEGLIVKLADGFLSLFRIGKLHEGKSALLPGLAVERDRDVRQISYRREVFPDLYFGCIVGKISNKKTN